MTALIIVEGVVILGLALLVAGLLRSHADILKALHELGVDMEHDHDQASFNVQDGVMAPGDVVGSPAHDISGSTLDGGALLMRLAGGEHTTLLAFLSSGCSSCYVLWKSLADEAPPQYRTVVVTRSAEDESVTSLKELAPEGSTVVMSSQAWGDYGVPGSPYFVLVDGHKGVIGEGSAGSWGRITKLLSDAGGDATRPRKAPGDVRETRADAELTAAGIEPGDPSLYPETDDQDDQ
jgi:hypothetical protein